MARSSPPTAERLHNPHPGEILAAEFMEPMGLSQNALARAVHVSPRRINELVNGQRGMTADTDLRLARYFGVSEGFFLGLQAEFDLMEERRRMGAGCRERHLPIAAMASAAGFGSSMAARATARSPRSGAQRA